MNPKAIIAANVVLFGLALAARGPWFGAVLFVWVVLLCHSFVQWRRARARWMASRKALFDILGYGD